MKRSIFGAVLVLAACSIEIPGGDDGGGSGGEATGAPQTTSDGYGAMDVTGDRPVSTGVASSESNSGSSGGGEAGAVDIVVIVDPSEALEPYADNLEPVMSAVADGAALVDAHVAVTTPTGAPWNTFCEAPSDFLTRNVSYPCEGWGAPFMDASDDLHQGMLCAGVVLAADFGPNATMQTMVDVLRAADCRGAWRREGVPLLYVLVTARDDDGSIGSPYVFGMALHEATNTPVSSIFIRRACDMTYPNLDTMVLAVNDDAVTYLDICARPFDQGAVVDAIVAAATT